MTASPTDRKRTTTKVVVFLVLTLSISTIWWYLAIKDGKLGDIQLLVVANEDFPSKQGGNASPEFLIFRGIEHR